MFTGNDFDYADDACWDGVVGHYYVEMIWFVPQGNYYSNVDQWCGALPCNDQASSHRWVGTKGSPAADQ